MKRNKLTRYSINPFWNRRRMNVKTKESFILMVINLNGHQFKISLDMKSTFSEYHKAVLTDSTRNVTAVIQSLRDTWHDYYLKAEMIFSRLQNPTQEIFTKWFKTEAELGVIGKTSLSYYFQTKIARLHSENRFSSSMTYKMALKAFKKYAFAKNKSMEIYFEEIDLKFLNGFVAFMTE